MRELEKIVRLAVIMTEESLIQPQDLQLEINPGAVPDNAETTESDLNLARARSITEKRWVTSALGLVDGNISKAAKLLDVSRPTLYSLIERPEIQIED